MLFKTRLIFPRINGPYVLIVKKTLKYLKTNNSHTTQQDKKTPTDRRQAFGYLQSLPRIWTRDKREQILLVASAGIEARTAGLRVRRADHLARCFFKKEGREKGRSGSVFIPVDLFTDWMISERAFINAKSSNRLPSFKLYILLAAFRRFFEDLLW